MYNFSFIKRFFAVICILAMFTTCGIFTASAEGETVKAPVYADSLNEGTYEIEVTSSASMFKIVHCDLTVSQGRMTAVMTLSGKGYEKLYLGTGEQALAAADEDFAYFTENDDGKYNYTVTVEALDKDIDCAAFSIKKQQWYDRVIVFESSSLPESAFVTKPETSSQEISEDSSAAAGFMVSVGIITCAVVVIAITAGAIIILLVRKNKN